MNNSLEKGFTAIELMTTILIAAILVALAAPSFVGMIDKNKVVAATNEMVGLLEFAKNTAKMSNKPTALFFCESKNVEGCDVGVAYVQDFSEGATVTLLRQMNWGSGVSVKTYDSSNTDIAFQSNGTRGIHVSTVSTFNDDGSFTSGNYVDFQNFGASSQFYWTVKSGNYCRQITVGSGGQVSVTIAEDCQ